jgi:ubiquinone/menaquinone biosynthesis C-methylase UbiE
MVEAAVDAGRKPIQSQPNEYVDFWNEILLPKFVRWKHILVDGLTHHSARVFPGLAVKEGDRVVDVGCGFGDTAILLAKKVGPTGSVLGIDCCDGFLEYGRNDAAAAGMDNVAFIEADVQTIPSSRSSTSASRALAPSSSRIPSSRSATCAPASGRAAS